METVGIIDQRWLFGASLIAVLLFTAKRRYSWMALLSAEWLLIGMKRANGGGIVFLRTVWASSLMYLLAVGCYLGTAWLFGEKPLQVSDTLTWFGVIFAATYAAFYARFSSQWTYLAGLFNQIKATEAITHKDNARGLKVLAEWKAAFIEDAQELHLATKPLFAAVLRAWIKDPDVACNFERYAPGGRRRLIDIAMKVEDAFRRHELEWPIVLEVPRCSSGRSENVLGKEESAPVAESQPSSNGRNY